MGLTRVIDRVIEFYYYMIWDNFIMRSLADPIQSILCKAFFSAVTEGRVDPAFHPSGVCEMGTVYIHRGNVVVNHPGMCIREQ